MSEPPDIPPQNDIHTLHKSLTTQATTLLSELTAYHTYLDTLLTTTPNPLITRPDTLLGKFEVDVRREVDHLLRYAGPVAEMQGDGAGRNQGGNGVVGKGWEVGVDADGEVELDGIHRIRSSNITFLADVWEGVKRSRGVVGVRKGVRYYPIVASGASSRDGGITGAGVDGGAIEETENGIKGVSKRMNREARERAKKERKLAQSQSQGSTQNPINRDINGKGNTTHKSSADSPDDHPKKTRGKLPTTTHTRKDTVTIDISTLR